MVVVVRTELGLSPGKMAAQVAHAAVTLTLRAMKDQPRRFGDWFDGGQKKVVLETSNLECLTILHDKAVALGVGATLVIDAGLTETKPSTVTCLGIGPAPDRLVDQVTGRLPLLREKQ